MDEKNKEELIKQMRFAINTQMRYKLYNDVAFPYMPSMGIKHTFQGFADESNDIFIGVYHLYWTPEEDKGIKVLNPTKPVVKGTWKHEWLTKEEAEVKQKEILDESLVDHEKLAEVIASEFTNIRKKNKEKKEKEELDNWDDKDIVLN